MNKIILTNGLDSNSISIINAYINNYKGKANGFTLEIKPVRDTRSLQQNKLLWVFMEAISRKVGDYPEACLVEVKKAYMKSKSIDKWLETSKLDVNEMNSFLSFTFDYLMGVVEGYLDMEEGNQWVQYKKQMEEL